MVLQQRLGQCNSWNSSIPQCSILGPLFFYIFINDIFLVVEKPDIFNFADDTVLYFHGSNLPLILSNPEYHRRNLLYWFKINSLKVNQGNVQFVILWKKNRLKYSLETGSITIKESEVTRNNYWWSLKF